LRTAGSHATVEVAVPHRRSGRTGEDECVVLLPHELAEVLCYFGVEQRGERHDALSSAGLGRAEGVAAAELLYQLPRNADLTRRCVDIASPQRGQLSPPQASENGSLCNRSRPDSVL
jgi:hypothetical protein